MGDAAIKQSTTGYGVRDKLRGFGLGWLANRLNSRVASQYGLLTDLELAWLKSKGEEKVVVYAEDSYDKVEYTFEEVYNAIGYNIGSLNSGYVPRDPRPKHESNPDPNCRIVKSMYALGVYRGPSPAKYFEYSADGRIKDSEPYIEVKYNGADMARFHELKTKQAK